VRASIDAGYPMIVAFDTSAWLGGGGWHMVLIVGYGWEGTDRYVYENNPVRRPNRYAVNPNTDPDGSPRDNVTFKMGKEEFGWKVWP
jgi:hypothetical protein